MDLSVGTDAPVNSIRLNQIEVSGYGGNGIRYSISVNDSVAATSHSFVRVSVTTP